MDGLALKAWRIAAGHSQESLAKALGTTRQTVNRWERNLFNTPAGIESRLGVLAPTAAPSKPSILTYVTAKAWPHLQLYVRLGKHHVRGPHHPEIVLRRDMPRPIDAAVLETDEYKSKINIKTT